MMFKFERNWKILGIPQRHKIS